MIRPLAHDERDLTATLRAVAKRSAWAKGTVSSHVPWAMRTGGAAAPTWESGLAKRIRASRSATVSPNNGVTTAWFCGLHAPGWRKSDGALPTATACTRLEYPAEPRRPSTPARSPVTPASAASCPPAEKPQMPIRSGSMWKDVACAQPPDGRLDIMDLGREDRPVAQAIRDADRHEAMSGQEGTAPLHETVRACAGEPTAPIEPHHGGARGCGRGRGTDHVEQEWPPVCHGIRMPEPSISGPKGGTVREAAANTSPPGGRIRRSDSAGLDRHPCPARPRIVRRPAQPFQSDQRSMLPMGILPGPVKRRHPCRPTAPLLPETDSWVLCSPQAVSGRLDGYGPIPHTPCAE